MPRQRLLLACGALHFLLVFGVSCRDALRLVAGNYTIIRVSPGGWWEKAEALASAALGQEASSSPPYPGAEALQAYTHLAGIECGYGYFAPNVPDSYKLLFELQYPDGHVEYDLSLFESKESTLRHATLLDQIGQMESDAMREILIKLVATSIWREHPEATRVNTILGSLQLPSVSEFEAGKRGSYEFMYAYDFSVNPMPSAPAP